MTTGKTIALTRRTFVGKVMSLLLNMLSRLVINCMDLTEAEYIKKRWQEYTEELYIKDLNDPDNHNDAINHIDRHSGV